MADTKISALTAATTPLAGTEEVAIVQSSTTKRVAVSDITNFAAMRLENTDTTTSINTASLTEIPLATATSFGTGFTQSTNAIQTDFAGTIELTASIRTEGTVVRSAIGCEFFKNGTSLGPRYNSSYVRATGGHNEANTICAPYIVTCADGDLFAVRGIQEAVSGTVDMGFAGSSYLQAKRLA